MSNRFLMIVVAILVIVGGIFVFTKHKNTDSSGGTTNSTVSPTSHFEGDNTKHVTLVEYGDYQCPACGAYYPIVKQVFDKYKTDITFQFRNYPLTQIHQHAFEGARAAEAADKQGKFWEMHDLLYENQQTWSAVSDPTSTLVGYAQQLGLDTTKFKQDMQSEAINNLINADIKEGQRLGIDATPTFFLDGKKLENPRSLDDFNKVIDTEIAANNK